MIRHYAIAARAHALYAIVTATLLLDFAIDISSPPYVHVSAAAFATRQRRLLRHCHTAICRRH